MHVKDVSVCAQDSVTKVAMAMAQRMQSKYEVKEECSGGNSDREL